VGCVLCLYLQRYSVLNAIPGKVLGATVDLRSVEVHQPLESFDPHPPSDGTFSMIWVLDDGRCSSPFVADTPSRPESHVARQIIIIAFRLPRSSPPTHIAFFRVVSHDGVLISNPPAFATTEIGWAPGIYAAGIWWSAQQPWQGVYLHDDGCVRQYRAGTSSNDLGEPRPSLRYHPGSVSTFGFNSRCTPVSTRRAPLCGGSIVSWCELFRAPRHYRGSASDVLYLPRLLPR